MLMSQSCFLYAERAIDKAKLVSQYKQCLIAQAPPDEDYEIG